MIQSTHCQPLPKPITALIVRVPEAEGLVGDLRVTLDPSAAEGAPAHITILVPFMSPLALSAEVLGNLRDALAHVRAFEFILGQIGRWPETAYLAPEPAEPFVELTTAVVRRFPEYPPHGGKHEAIIPHLTVADGSARGAEAAEKELRQRMAGRRPIVARCSAVEIMENGSGHWRTMRLLPLRGSDG